MAAESSRAAGVSKEYNPIATRNSVTQSIEMAAGIVASVKSMNTQDNKPASATATATAPAHTTSSWSPTPELNLTRVNNDLVAEYCIASSSITSGLGVAESTHGNSDRKELNTAQIQSHIGHGKNHKNKMHPLHFWPSREHHKGMHPHYIINNGILKSYNDKLVEFIMSVLPPQIHDIISSSVNVEFPLGEGCQLKCVIKNMDEIFKSQSILDENKKRVLAETPRPFRRIHTNKSNLSVLNLEYHIVFFGIF